MHYATFVERYFPIYLAVIGNIKVLPVFLCARSVVPTPTDYNYSRIHIGPLMKKNSEDAMEEYYRMIDSISEILHQKSGTPLDACRTILDGSLRRTVPQQISLSVDNSELLFEIGRRADQIDANLNVTGNLTVQRRDRFGMPFPEAEYLFPVYKALDRLSDIAACLDRHPVEIQLSSE